MHGEYHSSKRQGLSLDVQDAWRYASLRCVLRLCMSAKNSRDIATTDRSFGVGVGAELWAEIVYRVCVAQGTLARRGRGPVRVILIGRFSFGCGFIQGGDHRVYIV